MTDKWNGEIYNEKGMYSATEENDVVEFDRNARSYEESILITYDCKTKKFAYPSSLCEEYSELSSGLPFWKVMTEERETNKESAKKLEKRLLEMAESGKPQVHFEEFLMEDKSGVSHWYRVGFICPMPGEVVSLTFTRIDNEVADSCRLTQMTEHDRLTGLFKSSAFANKVDMLMAEDEKGVEQGEYALIYFDVLRFKAINDMFGMTEGDRLLKYIADTIRKLIRKEDVAGRHGSDRFVIFTKTSGEELEKLVEHILAEITTFDLSFEITCNVGVYVTGEEKLSVDLMIDRAVLAQSVIKGSYTERYNFYTEELRNAMLTEQEIAGMMATALAERHFVAYFQPQYNHSSGTLVGAEALVRWKHPERGLISPGIFIPIFEKNGFITKLDLYVFEEACRFIRQCMDEGLPVVPVSSNFSRHDIFQPDFVEQLEACRKKYDVPTKYVRVEITESAIVGGSQLVNEVVQKLHEHGYIVEMDDFGTGYSSLNVLKDIDLDIIKLDMMFLSEKSKNNRGGTIVSSVVRMAKWLEMPVIAEGVETVEQADFLRSIGCDYIQGYLYSRPLEEKDYKELLTKAPIGITSHRSQLTEKFDGCNFWDPKSYETLIFSNFVGGAAIFEYTNGKMEILRVNKKYMDEIYMNVSEKELLATDAMGTFDEENGRLYEETLQKAIETGEEQECDTWRVFESACCGDDRLCIRSTIRMIGKSGDTYLFYAMIRNVTTEKMYYEGILDSERRFKAASEQVNIYYWEYDIETKEMRPCFRCMRDLGMPAVLTNYPQSAFDMGVFPPEVHEMYRDWMQQIDNGVGSLEAEIPLTEDRIPFMVRYTTEFDDKGHPVKAYGSAALIVDKE